MRGIVLPKDIKIVVASFGGVGTTFLLKFLANYTTTNHPDDLDGFKHLPLPPISLRDGVKYIYVYGDPQIAVISLFRRNHQYSQSRKLQQWLYVDDKPIPRTMTVDEYALGGIDRLHVEDHFINWYSRYLPSHPTMFIKYDSIFDNADKIVEFAGLPPESVKQFPKKKTRMSDLERISPATLDRLNDIYGRFADDLSGIDNVVIRSRSRDTPPAAAYLQHPYPRLIAREAICWPARGVKKKNPELYAMLRRIQQTRRGDVSFKKT